MGSRGSAAGLAAALAWITNRGLSTPPPWQHSDGCQSRFGGECNCGADTDHPLSKSTASAAEILQHGITRAVIVGASVAVQAHQHLQDGRGGVDHESMRRFVEEAEAVAEIYDEVKNGE